jgi:hypothetical protein
VYVPLFIHPRGVVFNEYRGQRYSFFFFVPVFLVFAYELFEFRPRLGLVDDYLLFGGIYRLRLQGGV